jgi:hypothetical protein
MQVYSNLLSAAADAFLTPYVVLLQQQQQQQEAGTQTQKSFLHKRCTLNGGFEYKKKQLMIHKIYLQSLLAK